MVAVLVVLGPTSLESSPVAPVRLQVASTVVVVSVEVVASRLLVARQPVLFRAAVLGGGSVAALTFQVCLSPCR